MNKKLLRNYLRNKLKLKAQRRVLSLFLVEYYLKKKLLANFKNLYNAHSKLNTCKVVSLYYPLRYEIDCKPIIKWLWHKNIVVCLPKVIDKHKVLKFYRFNKSIGLSKNAMGIFEPIKEEPVIPEAVIMPVIGFDIKGYRLGQGGGYYDSTICALKNKAQVITIGLGYNWQEVTTVFPEYWDVKLDAVVTNNFYKLFNNLN